MRLPNPFSLTLFALTVFFVVPLFTHAQGFVPLTTIPGLSTVSESGSIAAFLNNLYKISIGVAAVLAVLQITRAGIMYMTEESIAEKKEARHLITMSLLGLLLVLSPAIVFGIIDPRILDLNVDVSSIRPSGNGSGDENGASQQTTGAQTQGSGSPQTPSNTGTQDPGGQTSSEDVTCGPGEVEEFSASGITCVPDTENQTNTTQPPQSVNVSFSVPGNGFVFFGYIRGAPSAYTCGEIGTPCQYTNSTGPACTYIIRVFESGNSGNAEARRSCQTDPSVSRVGGQVFYDCIHMAQAEVLRRSVPGPLCSGQSQN